MAWRKHVLLKGTEPITATIYTSWSPAGFYVGNLVLDGAIAYTSLKPTAADAEQECLSVLDTPPGPGLQQVGQRSTSEVRCGRNAADAVVLYHFLNIIVLADSDLQALSQSSVDKGFAAVDALLPALAAGYQAEIKRWQNDQTVHWNELVYDAQRVAQTTSLYMPRSLLP